jgi:hypothetical protein
LSDPEHEGDPVPWPIYAHEMGADHIPDEDSTAVEDGARRDRPGPSPNWRTLDAAATSAEMTTLAAWVHWFVDRYALRSLVPPCWGAHGPMIEELSALAAAWRGAYEAVDAAPEAALLWHEHLDGWRNRWATWNVDNCNINTHRPTLDVIWPHDANRPG